MKMNKISIRVVLLFELIWICFIVFFINTYTNKSTKNISEEAIKNLEDYREDSINPGSISYDEIEKLRFYVGQTSYSYDDTQDNAADLTEKEIEDRLKYIEEHPDEEFEPRDYWNKTYPEYRLVRAAIKEYDSIIKKGKILKKKSEIKKFYEEVNKRDPRKIEVDGKTFYIDKYMDPYNMELDIEEKQIQGYFINYINVTARVDSIERTRRAIIFAAIIVAVIGLICGMFVGSYIGKADKSQRSFFENASHELKTPLAKLRCYSDVLKDGDKDKLKESGAYISKQTDKMTKLVEDVLCVARIESGVITLDKEDVDISEIIQDCLMPFENVIRKKELDIDLDVKETIVQVDIKQFERALNNIYEYACDKAKSEISIENNDKVINIGFDMDNISDNDIKHIFDRFYTKDGSSTGVILSVVKDIINYHAYKIDAKKTANGMKFVIDFRG